LTPDPRVRRRIRLVLWIAFAFTIPLPFFLVMTGAVPAVRLAFLVGIHLAVIAAEGTQGAVGLATAILLGQLLPYLGALWLLAHIVSGWLARGSRRRALLLTFALAGSLVAVAASADLYRTPFRTESLRGSLWDVFD
jgi:hypothetical protein